MDITKMEMRRNAERAERIRDALTEAHLDAFVSTLAAHLVMLTGYWPVIGNSFAIATKDQIAVLLPEDERHLSANCWADLVKSYAPSGLESVRTSLQSAVPPLSIILRKLGLLHARLGYERGPISEPSSYAAMHLFGGSILEVLKAAAPQAILQPADESLERLDSVKTRLEIERIRQACTIASDAFEDGRASIHPGTLEPNVAAAFRSGLSASPSALRCVRADGFVYCMSGENSAKACGAFAQTGRRQLGERALVLIHCNSHAEGYWTDITRTYELGEPDCVTVQWRHAVMEARAAAFSAIAPGARAATIDRAARDVFRRYGFAGEFKHSTGHGVGFAAISANARPRLHPASPDIIEEGMVFNVEPALYKEGFGGLRHCDMVAVTRRGVDLLSPFHCRTEDLIVASRRAA